jgi:hypothetical protein
MARPAPTERRREGGYCSLSRASCASSFTSRRGAMSAKTMCSALPWRLWRRSAGPSRRSRRSGDRCAAAAIALIHVVTGSIMLAPFAGLGSLRADLPTWSVPLTLGLVHTGPMYALRIAPCSACRPCRGAVLHLSCRGDPDRHHRAGPPPAPRPGRRRGYDPGGGGRDDARLSDSMAVAVSGEDECRQSDPLNRIAIAENTVSTRLSGSARSGVIRLREIADTRLSLARRGRPCESLLKWQCGSGIELIRNRLSR